MKLTSNSFQNNGPIDVRNAMGVAAPSGATASANKSPHLSWSDFPSGTRSFAIICRDKDAPSKRDDANRNDRIVPYDLPRVDFIHWVLVDIPATTTELAEGADADGIVAKGKQWGSSDVGVRGINDYTSWFAGDAAMEGDYGGYDGPWPPFNDERLHHYEFTVYALDVPSLNLSGKFTAAEARDAMKGHILDQAQIQGTYAINPKARE